MVQVSTFQECRSVEGWQAVVVSSDSQAESYTVLVNPWGFEAEAVCDCKGYKYTGHCKHQARANEKVCRWREGESPRQSEQQKEKMVCPRCGGATKWSFEEDE
jgi:hypothetical protein